MTKRVEGRIQPSEMFFQLLVQVRIRSLVAAVQGGGGGWHSRSSRSSSSSVATFSNPHIDILKDCGEKKSLKSITSHDGQQKCEDCCIIASWVGSISVKSEHIGWQLVVVV